MWAAATAAGIGLSYPQAVAVTAVTIAAQTIAVTPGGIGGYEAAATAALVGLGAGPGPALAAALVAHATKTAYALVVGGVAAGHAGPGVLRPAAAGPRGCRPGRRAVPAAPDAPVVAVIPVHNEAATVGDVVRRLPAVACGRPVRTVVVDDGSTDGSAALAAAAGATVVAQPRNLGLGAAVRRALAEAERAATRPAWSTSTRTASTPPRSWSGWPRRCWPAGPTTWSAPGSPAGPGGCGRTGRPATGC